MQVGIEEFKAAEFKETEFESEEFESVIESGSGPPNADKRKIEERKKMYIKRVKIKYKIRYPGK